MTLYYYLHVFYTHFLCFVLFCTCEFFFVKETKKFKTDLMTSFILLLTLHGEIFHLKSIVILYFHLIYFLKIETE